MKYTVNTINQGKNWQELIRSGRKMKPFQDQLKR